jgi:hypothetical protein
LIHSEEDRATEGGLSDPSEQCVDLLGGFDVTPEEDEASDSGGDERLDARVFGPGAFEAREDEAGEGIRGTR